MSIEAEVAAIRADVAAIRSAIAGDGFNASTDPDRLRDMAIICARIGWTPTEYRVLTQPEREAILTELSRPGRR